MDKRTQRTETEAPRKPGVISRSEAGRRLDRLQTLIGITLIASAVFGVYLLATDKSLWLLAVSHAYGLLAICTIDAILAIANLLSVRKILLPTLGVAFLTILLQIGDIATAPQYKMTVEYFARYLFGLWAYDANPIDAGIGYRNRAARKIIPKNGDQEKKAANLLRYGPKIIAKRFLADRRHYRRVSCPRSSSRHLGRFVALRETFGFVSHFNRKFADNTDV